MIEVEAKEGPSQPKRIGPFTERLMKTVTEIMDTARTYQIVLRTLLFVEFLQVLYFSISGFLDNIWDMNVFSYLVTLTGYLNFEQAAKTGNSQTMDSFLGICLAINGGAVLFLILLPTVFISTQKPVTGIASLVVKACTLYMIAFNSLLIIPFAQVSYLGMQCNPSSVYYQSTS